MRRDSCPNCRKKLFEPAPLDAPREPLVYTSQYGPLKGFGHGELAMPLGSQDVPRLLRPMTAQHPLRRDDAASGRNGFQQVGSPNANPARSGQPPVIPRYQMEVQSDLTQNFLEFSARECERLSEPPRPPTETTVPNNEHVWRWFEDERILGSHDYQVMSTSREVSASMTTEDLETLVRGDHVSVDRQGGYVAGLALRHEESDLYASPKVQISRDEPARSPGPAFVPFATRQARRVL